MESTEVSSFEELIFALVANVPEYHQAVFSTVNPRLGTQSVWIDWLF